MPAKPETTNTLFADLLNGAEVKMPPAHGTFKQAPKEKGKDAEQKELGL
jgi:hypothetical protein